MMDMGPHTARFISSQKTAASETQKRIMKLGKALVKELRLEPGVDTLSRWMAHYIAEQMAFAKKARGAAKRKAEQTCCETILKLWQHRSHLPGGSRPFENFDPIFRALARLDPENETPFFYSNPDPGTKKKIDEDAQKVQEWLAVARAIDKTARIWIDFVFQQAALNASNDETMKWLDTALGASRDMDDISIVVRLIDPSEDTENAAAERQERLKARLEQLDAFISFNEMIRTALSGGEDSASQSDNFANEYD